MKFGHPRCDSTHFELRQPKVKVQYSNFMMIFHIKTEEEKTIGYTVNWLNCLNDPKSEYRRHQTESKRFDVEKRVFIESNGKMVT